MIDGSGSYDVQTNPLESAYSIIDFVLITALEEERDAILSKLGKVQRVAPDFDDVYTYHKTELATTFPDGSKGSYKIVLMTLLQMGRLDAGIAVSNLIAKWRPHHILLVGIAGGIRSNHISLGDVLVADQVVDYELQKMTTTASSKRYVVHPVDNKLFSFSQSLMPEAWQKRISCPRPKHGAPKRLSGPIATGDKVIANQKFLKRLLKDWSKLIGVEMEAGGVAKAAFQSATKPRFLMIRGVSDLADGDKDSKATSKWRPYACDVAASYAVALLENGPVPVTKDSTTHLPQSIQQVTHVADLNITALSDDRVSALDGHPVLKDTGGRTIYTGGARLSFTLSHNKQGSHSILVYGLRPHIHSYDMHHTHDYTVRGDLIYGAGTTQPHVFRLILDRLTIKESEWISKDGTATKTSSSNLFQYPGSDVLTLRNDNDDVEEIQGTVLPVTPGLYEISFEVLYSIGGKDKSKTSDKVHIYKSATLY